jgi:hypothetical protein
MRWFRVTHLVMKYSAPIATRIVSSEHPYVIYSHTEGVLSEHETLEGAHREWERQLAQATERGRDSDALLFQWSIHEWTLCGNLYDIEGPATRAWSWCY